MCINFKKIFFLFYFILFSSFGQETISIEVNWPAWSSENRVIVRNPSTTQIGSICDPSNCFVNNVGNFPFTNSSNPTIISGLTAGTGYSLILEDRWGDGWNGSGAYVRVYQNGNLLVQSTLASGTISNPINFTVAASSNAPPIINATGNQNYCRGTSIPVVQTISITDSDSNTAQSASVQISSGYVNGQDILNLTGTHPSITATWSAVEGKLTLNGPATLTAFQNAILAVRYSNNSSNPSGSRSFSISIGDANFLPATGHYYEFVPNLGITWTAARDAAALRTYYGLQGYLATLTSLAEAQFSGSQAQGTGWIGASDAAVEGDWRWVTGPEAGTPFWTGTASGNTVAPTNFAYWNGGEPNQSGNEDYAHITDPSVVRNGAPVGSWNDLSNTGAGSGPYQPKGYIVEYGGSSGDPVLNISATTSIQIDNQAPTWVTAIGDLNENYQCASDVPSLGVCTSLNSTFFNQQRFAWGFGLQNSTGAIIPNWEVRINNANYQLNVSQLSNQSAFTYTEIDNGNGTFNLILKGTSAIPAFGSIPGGNIQWSGVNFGFNPTSSGISVFCGTVPNVLPVATDNCGTVTINEVSNVTVNNGCQNNYTQTISYQASDSSGNLSTLFVKTIRVNDTTSPTASNLSDITVYCSSDIPTPNILLVNDEADNCTGNLTVAFVSDVSNGLSNPETITRTYSITDACNNSINVTQLIRVNQILITTQPSNQTLGAGQTASFSVIATNANSYQWQVSVNNGTSFSNISGAVNATLNIPNVSVANTGNLYRVLVNNTTSSCATIISNTGTLTVGPRSVITNRRITYRVDKN